MDDARAWALEERFWLDGPAVYDAHLDPDCVMVFPGLGAMRAAEVLDSLRDAPRWDSVVLTGRVVGRPGDGVVVLGYAADGHRAGAASYRCHCTSTYRATADGWTLVQHQQTGR